MVTSLEGLNKHEKFIAEAKTRDQSGVDTTDARMALGPRLEVNLKETIIEKFFVEGHKFT